MPPRSCSPGTDSTPSRIRHIAAAAKIPVALGPYHFTNKQVLFESVIARRADVPGERRRQALRSARLAAPLTVEAILGAFVEPYLEFRIGRQRGWSNYGALIAQIAQDRRWLPLIERYFDATAFEFRDALLEALPKAPAEKVLRGFFFSIQLMVSALANNGRLESLSRGAVPGADLQSIYADLILFLCGGFAALAQAPAPARC